MSTVKLTFLTEDAYQLLNDKLDKLGQKADQEETLTDSVWLTSKEVARILRISTWTLRLYRKDGRITYYRLGRKILYKQEYVLQALENFKVPAILINKTNTQ
ncbi:MAG TPA: helix-turn-helix domain-containing protein [Chitinophagaceae bacterium]|nr:helix-turn-helix domain-containing protein [Chitinophagaceae bacterium]